MEQMYQVAWKEKSLSKDETSTFSFRIFRLISSQVKCDKQKQCLGMIVCIVLSNATLMEKYSRVLRKNISLIVEKTQHRRQFGILEEHWGLFVDWHFINLKLLRPRWKYSGLLLWRIVFSVVENRHNQSYFETIFDLSSFYARSLNTYAKNGNFLHLEGWRLTRRCI